MNSALWTVQIFLAITFLYSGIMKSTRSEQWLVTHGQTGVAGLPLSLIRFIGIIEIIGVIGLILPAWLNIFPILTPVTAIGFCIIMILAAPKHYRRREYKSIGINAFVFLLSLFVAVGRLLD